MPLPVLHTYAGYQVSQWLDRSKENTHSDASVFRWKTLAIAVFLSNLPDFDFIPGILIGDANRFHHGITHSFAAGILVGLLAAAGAWLLMEASCVKTFVVTFSVYSTHILLDFCSCTRSVPLFWPISHLRFGTPHMLFPTAGMDTNHVSGLGDFADAIHSYGCLNRLSYEIFIVFFLTASSWMFRLLSERLSRKTAAVLSGSFTAIGIWIYAKTIGIL